MNDYQTANSLLSIANYWGADITAEQEKWLYSEVDLLSNAEQEKFLDLYKGVPAEEKADK